MPVKIPKLMMVTTGSLAQDTASLEVVLNACKHDLPALQLREKTMEAKDLLSLATLLRKATTDNGVFFTINGRLDVALAVKADGIHLSESGLSPSTVKKMAPDIVVGVSTHSIDAALRAEQEGADYVLFGPVFYTPSKAQFGTPQGLEQLSVVTSRLKIPVIAVGGISPLEAKKCFKAGAHGIACINALMHSKDIKGTIQSFKGAEHET